MRFARTAHDMDQVGQVFLADLEAADDFGRTIGVRFM